mgnify:CR=1 FL=1
MKKSRVLAVVMAVLMMVTLLPSMVFATAAPSGTLDGKLKVKGTLAIGSTLSADYSKVKPEGITDDNVSFSWSLKDGDLLTEVGTDKTYKIDEKDLGLPIVLKITGKEETGVSGELTVTTQEVSETEEEAKALAEKKKEEAKAAGVDEFISKPLFRSRLTAALQKIISGKPSQDARDYLKNIAASDYTGKKILLVEDNELNREVAAEIIGMTGAEIEMAVNGKEAVDKVADHPNGYYDLVFMDVQMPIMNGYEAATAIRSLPKHKGELLPIVAMTANAFTEDVILAKSAGMNEHIAKPLDMEKLNRILHEWM